MSSIEDMSTIKPNQDMVSFMQSVDFRILMTQDPVLRQCFFYGKTPLETIVILADRAEAMRKEIEKIYRCGLPKVIINPQPDEKEFMRLTDEIIARFGRERKVSKPGEVKT